MAGFLKKMAGAFIYLDEKDEKSKAPANAEGGVPDIDDIGRDASDLIAQLGKPPRAATAAAGDTGAAAMDLVTSAGASITDMTADAVFSAAGIPDGPSSAQRVLRIIAGLTMFTKEQQVLMVRAMDAADDAWSEKDVLEDARRRQSALRSHLQSVDADRSARLQSIALRVEQAQADGKRRLSEIDAQLAEIQKLRQDAVAFTGTTLNELDQEKRQTEEAADKARRSITTVVNLLSDLITFFMGGEGRSAAKS